MVSHSRSLQARRECENLTPTSKIINTFKDYVVPSYTRSLVLVRGKGSYVWDVDGKKYLDFGGGIAVNSLGHAHPAVVRALKNQASKLIHTTNLYYTEPQGKLARELVKLTGLGKVFFCNSGAEANEALFKLARKFGQESGKFEIVTAVNSFHGRTIAGIAATGQEKIKKGFAPIIPGFVHVPFNDLEAFEKAITPQTAAILIEGIQGEGGVIPATKEFLLGIRKLTRERGILLFIDAVQCGFFRTGNFQSYQTILGKDAKDFLPDGISMAKGLGGGFPIGAVWIEKKYADLFQPGTHGTTFGGTPLACAVSLAVIDTVKKQKLAQNIRQQGARLMRGLQKIKSPNIVEVRGLGGMIGLQITGKSKDVVARLMEKGLLVVPAGDHVLRFLPPLNIRASEVDDALEILKNCL
ncbi:MAG: aspartate aminotransferase family protein [Verrucomicrobiota bacterium]